MFYFSNADGNTSFFNHICQYSGKLDLKSIQSSSCAIGSRAFPGHRLRILEKRFHSHLIRRDVGSVYSTSAYNTRKKFKILLSSTARSAYGRTRFHCARNRP